MTDDGMVQLERFFNAHRHDGWSVSAFDARGQLASPVEVSCPWQEAAACVAWLARETRGVVTLLAELPERGIWVVGIAMLDACVAGGRYRWRGDGLERVEG